MMTLEEMKKTISKDPETKGLTLLDVDIYKVYQYLLERDEHKDKNGYRPVLRTEPYIEIVYRPTREKAI
jgi:primosomal protein DnaI